MKSLAFALTLVALASPADAALVVDNTALQNSSISSFGEPNTATYGQTFTVGADNRLDSFTFFVNDRQDSDFVDFRAYVYAWDGSKASGSALFQSGNLSTTNNGGANGFEAINIFTGGTQLQSGQQYVAFFSASGLFDGQNGTSSWASVTGASSVAGGGFVYLNNGNNLAMLTTQAWSQNFQCGGCDLSYRMSFNSSDVPEPTSLALVGLGLAGVWLRKRKAG